MAKYESIVVSCEHAGNEVPARYKQLFKGHEKRLKSHEGYDPGAWEAAKKIAQRLHTNLILSTTTRLLIEPNRSLDSKTLFSSITKKLPDLERTFAIEKYYTPYRSTLEAAIKKAITKNGQVLHLSIHSCTNELNGEVRNMDYGILYDPKREREKQFAADLKAAIINIDANRVVRFNYPYLGTADGVCTSMRELFNEEQYLGIEIEINQKYVEGADKTLWEHIQQVLAEAFAQVCHGKSAE